MRQYLPNFPNPIPRTMCRMLIVDDGKKTERKEIVDYRIGLLCTFTTPSIIY